MNTIVRLNELKLNDTFKRSERYSGTVTYKVVGNLSRSTAYKNEYNLPCKVVSCTAKDGFFTKLIGETVNVTSIIKYGRLGKVTKVN